jgi:hypothetical protein
MGKTNNACKILDGKPRDNRQLGRSRREDNNKMDRKEIIREDSTD